MGHLLSLGTIMDEMANLLRDAYDSVDLDGNTVQVEPRMVVNPSPPSIDIYPGDPSSRETDTAGMGDFAGGYVFVIRCRVGTADSVAGQDLLLRFIDDTDDLCLGLAFEADETLNGWATQTIIEPPTGFGLYPQGDNALLGCQWRATVLPAVS